MSSNLKHLTEKNIGLVLGGDLGKRVEGSLMMEIGMAGKEVRKEDMENKRKRDFARNLEHIIVSR